MNLAKSHILTPRQPLARSRGESAAPNLWNGLSGLWVPAAGISGITTLYDESGNANHGTLNGTMNAADWVMTPYGWSLDLDGTDDYISVPDHGSLDITPALTIHVTCRPTVSGNSAFRTILAKRENSATTNYQLYLSNAAGSNAGVLGYYNGTAEYKSTEIPIVNQWNNLAATVIGTSLTLWINGKVVHTATLSASPVANTGTLGIGRPGSYVGGSEYFQGQIVAAYVYRRALSASEINQLNANPLEALRPRRVYTAGVNFTGTLAGSADLAISGTGLLTGSGALSGSSALAISGTNLLTGSGALSGSAALALGASFTSPQTVLPTVLAENFNILAPELVTGASPTALGLSFSIQTPTIVLSTTIVTPNVLELDFVVEDFNHVVTPETLELVLEEHAPTTYYPILISPPPIPLVLGFPKWNLAITPELLELDLTIETPAGNAIIHPDLLELTFGISTPNLLFSGSFFCFDACVLFQPGFQAVTYIDGLLQAAKVNCGE